MSSNNCLCCGKGLSDPLSIEIGYGPVCRINEKEKDASDTNLNLFGGAEFQWFISEGVLVIIDCISSGASVTNDIENVLSQISSLLTKVPRKCIYQDSIGVFDEVLVDDNFGFKSFKYVGEKDLGKAIAIVKENNLLVGV